MATIISKQGKWMALNFKTLAISFLKQKENINLNCCKQKIWKYLSTKNIWIVTLSI